MIGKGHLRPAVALCNQDIASIDGVSDMHGLG
jgi:hypothetical protein